VKQIAVLGNANSLNKTFVTASIAHLASKEGTVAIVDTDLDSTSLAMFLTTQPDESHEWQHEQEAHITTEQCKNCGACYDVCQFNAVQAEPVYKVIPLACIGCGACEQQCPVEAISMAKVTTGHWHRSETRFGPLFYGRLAPGRHNSGAIVTQLRQQANLWSLEHQASFVIIDGPPGVSAPSIIACAGVDLTILVIAPTITANRDLERLIAMGKQTHSRQAVIINQQNTHLDRATQLAEQCAKAQIPVLGQIDDGPMVSQSMVTGRLMTEAGTPMGEQLTHVWSQTAKLVGLTKG